MKIVFFGTSEFAVPALEALHKANFDLTVITRPDKPVGRKNVLTSPPIKVVAEKLGLKVLQPTKLKDDSFFEEFSALAPDICIVAAYGKIIPERYLAVPKYFLNIHPSLLPKYRGPTPIQTAILNSDAVTGVTIMQVDREMDHGDIVSSIKYRVLSDKYYKEIYDDLAELGAQLLIETIPKLISGKIKPQAQDHSQATFTKIYERADARIDWSRTPEEIYNQIRALNPEPGTWTTWHDRILNIRSAELANETQTDAGKKLKIIIKTLQLEGKKETSLSEFLHGHSDFDVSQLK